MLTNDFWRIQFFLAVHPALFFPAAGCLSPFSYFLFFDLALVSLSLSFSPSTEHPLVAIAPRAPS